MSRVAVLGDGGINAAAVSLTNTGRKAGIPVDFIKTDASCTLTWDNTRSFLGNASMHVTTVSGGNSYVRWQQMYRPVPGAAMVATAWVYFTANPGASTSVAYIGDNASARVTEMRVTSTGKVSGYDSAGTAKVTTVASIALNQWVRVGLYYTPDAVNGSLQVKLFNNPLSSVPTEATAVVTGNNLRTNAPIQFFVGTANASAFAHNYWIQGYHSDSGAAPFGTGWIQSRWIGGVTQTSANMVCRALGVTTGVRWLVSTSAALTAPVTSSSVLPDTDGVVRLSVAGLQPYTDYFYGLEVDGTVDQAYNGVFRTMPADQQPISFAFAAASCARNQSDSPAYDTIRSYTGPTGKTPLFFMHLGDLHYKDVTANDPTAVHTAYDTVQGSKRPLDFFGNIHVPYTWSDHDATGPNGDSTSAALLANQPAYRSRVPSYPLTAVDGKGIYHTFSVGRVLFIVTDGRSYMSPIAATDNAAKTKLGATQKAWLKTQLTNPNYALKIWFHEDAWNNASTFANDDTWGAYQTERTELANFILANKCNMAYVNGDLHCLAADDGLKNSWGAFPIYVCSPLDQTTFRGNGLYSSAPYPNYDSVAPDYYTQFGAFDVVDNGNIITLTFKGISADGTVRMTQSLTWPRVYWSQLQGNGTETRLLLDGQYNGTTETAVSLDSVQ